MREVYNFTQVVIMKNNRPPILQSDWSIASRHGRTSFVIQLLLVYLYTDQTHYQQYLATMCHYYQKY